VSNRRGPNLYRLRAVEAVPKSTASDADDRAGTDERADVDGCRGTRRTPAWKRVRRRSRNAALVAFCEQAAREAIDPLLPEGQTTVGGSIDLRHTAPTPPGLRVTVTACLVEVDGRRLTFEVEARDEIEPIGCARHERFVIDAERFQARAIEKIRAAEGSGSE